MKTTYSQQVLSHLHDAVVHPMTTDGVVLTTGGEPSTTGAEVTTTGGEAMMTEDVTFLQHLHQILVLSQTVQPVLCHLEQHEESVLFGLLMIACVYSFLDCARTFDHA